MVQNVGAPDVRWLLRLLKVIEEIHQDYPELFSKEDEETMMIAGQLIRSLQ